MLGVEPCAVYIKRVAHGGIVDLVGVFLFDARADGVEALGHLTRVIDGNVHGQVGIQRVVIGVIVVVAVLLDVVVRNGKFGKRK